METEELEKRLENLEKKYRLMSVYFESSVDFFELSKNTDLDEEFIDEYKSKLDFDLISTNHKLPINILRKYKKELNWKLISARRDRFLSIEELEEFSSKVYWLYITENIGPRFRLYPVKNSENADKMFEFIEHFKDKLNWKYLSKHMKFNLHQLQKFKDYIDWNIASRHQTLTEASIKKFHEFLDWDLISEYQNITPETYKKFMGVLNKKDILNSYATDFKNKKEIKELIKQYGELL
jgi:hypothetical protein